MKEKVGIKMVLKRRISIQTILLGLLGIFLIWMIVVMIDSSILRDGLLQVTEDKTCKLKELGTTEKGKIVYSYCFSKVELEKVLIKDKTISEELLTKGLKKKDCLWDGGTCTYIAKKYQIIVCNNQEEKDTIIITNKEISSDEAYSKFCEGIYTTS